MPNMKGLTMLNEPRKVEVLQQTMAILTVISNQDERVELGEGAALVILSKPFGPLMLAYQIKQRYKNGKCIHE